MIKVLGFFNLLFGLLEVHGLYKHFKNLQIPSQNNFFSYMGDNAYEIYILPLLLISIGISSIVIGLINLGAIPPKNSRQKTFNILIGAGLIFSSAIFFWDLIII